MQTVWVVSLAVLAGSAAAILAWLLTAACGVFAILLTGWLDPEIQPYFAAPLVYAPLTAVPGFAFGVYVIFSYPH